MWLSLWASEVHVARAIQGTRTAVTGTSFLQGLCLSLQRPRGSARSRWPERREPGPPRMVTSRPASLAGVSAPKDSLARGWGQGEEREASGAQFQEEMPQIRTGILIQDFENYKLV